MKVGTHPNTSARRRPTGLRPTKGIHPEDIKAALRKRGITLADLSRQHGYTPNAVGLVLHGRRRSAPLRRIIAAAVGRPEHEIWPERYRRGS